MTGRFEGKVGIITGAGSGIGKATIERFVREGGDAVAVDVSQARLDQLSAEFKAHSKKIRTVHGDLTSDRTISEIMSAERDSFITAVRFTPSTRSHNSSSSSSNGTKSSMIPALLIRTSI